MRFDRTSVILAELAKGGPSHYQDGGKVIGAVYLSSESIGIIVCQAAAIRLEMAKLQDEVDRLSDMVIGIK